MARVRGFSGRVAVSAISFLCLATPAPAAAEELTRATALYEHVNELNKAGNYTDAIPLAEEALAIREKALAPDNPDVATSLNQLALLYRMHGRYAEAEPLYQRSVAIREKVFGPIHPAVAQSLSNLAALYVAQGRYGEAEALFKRSLDIREKALGPDNPEVAENLNNLAVLFDDQGRYAEAEPLHQHSLAVREKALGPGNPDVAVSLSNLALLYEHQGRHAEAEPLYKRSLTIREQALGPNHPDVANSLNNLAVLYGDQGRHTEAEPLYQRSLAIREKVFGPDHPAVATGLANLAGLYEYQGRYAEAEALYQRSLAIREKTLGPDHPDVASSLSHLALLYAGRGRSAEAEALFKRSLDIREKALGPDHPDIATTLNNLAELYFRQRRYAEALNFSRRAVAVLCDRLARSDPGSTGDEAEQRKERSYFLTNVKLVYIVGEPTAIEESFRVAQWASASAAAQAVAGMAARFAAGNDAMAATIRERQDLADRWRGLDKAIIAAVGRLPAQRDPAAEGALRAELAKIGTALDALDARIAKEFPGYAELSKPKPLELAQAQALLAPDEAMLVYLVDRSVSGVWAIRRDRAALYKLDIGADALSAEVTALRSRLDPARNPDLAPFDALRAAALYRKIVAPAAALLDGARAVFIVPDGALQSLPFEVLVTKPPRANPEHLADHRDIAWLMRDYALTVLPSVGSLRALREFTTAGHGALPFVGIGDPVLAGDPAAARGVRLADLFRGRLADVDKVRALPPLPDTADELRAVARDLGAGPDDLYLGARASEPLLRQAGLDRYRIVEFATHGLMSGDIAGLAEPALVLTPPQEARPENDGLLTASKIATLKFDADWVVLSACNTAAADGAPDAEGLSGLAKAFFYAGARSILVSHWSVESNATVKLITDAFAELQKDTEIGRAEALRRAELAMLDPQNSPEFAHPLVWAPFVLAGEGGVGR